MRDIVFWVEGYFYSPNLLQKIISFLLLPLSYIYCFVMFLRYKLTKEVDFGIDIVSVGNLSVGGSGKTPLVTALAKNYSDVAIILRGYGRKSKGLVVVSDAKEVLCKVEQSGDEAMIYALKVPKAIVIVSEDRVVGIKKAKEMGAKLILLDDAYSKHNIKKLDLLIDVDTKNQNCLPSGAFRERLWTQKKAVVLKEGRDFKRVVKLLDKSDKMSLITAIARASRLDDFLPQVVSKNYFKDHHSFTKDEVVDILKRDNSESALVTFKDYVKLKDFGIKISLLDLDLEVDERVFKTVEEYIDAKKD
ncbi:MAG: tetraacyldisaccharide 4'-kinase [Sulfurimonas sp.]